MTPAISVIVATYNQEAWLEKVLHGYLHQRFRDFELVIADDGSGPATRELIARYQDRFAHPIQHVWHADDGFRKTRILNRAILAARAGYLVFTDGDCIPRADFLQVQHALRRPGRFLSGSCVRLPMATSLAIGLDDIASGRCFAPDWLRANGLPAKQLSRRLTAGGAVARLLDLLSPAGAEFYGNNASCWKDDALRVNGFDERMRYGGLDWEFGDRLKHAGIKPLRARYRAIVVHLEHGRSYADPALIAANKAIWDAAVAAKAAWTEHGLSGHREPA